MESTTSSTKAPCVICGHKAVGVFKCEGCMQAFCRKHVTEHRDTLNHQLDEIVVEYDTLQQTIVENKDKENHYHSLIGQIDKWEHDSVGKIQQTAQESREQVKTMIHSQKETITNKLHNLGEQLRRARENDDYVEVDLQAWTSKLEKLKHDIDSVSTSIHIREDSTKVFISKMYIFMMNKSLSTQEERFGDYSGDIYIEDNGRIASYNGAGRSSAYVRGKGEYSKGKHQIRFVMNKKTSLFIMSFNIVSKSLPMPRTSFSNGLFPYGWHTDDCVNNPESDYDGSKPSKDLRGEKKFELEFTIDCDNRKISYFNEQTKHTNEMNVNLDMCPFPWQLEFYLYDIGDRVQILSSIEVS